MKKKGLILLLGMSMIVSANALSPAESQSFAKIDQKIQTLQEQITTLEAKLAKEYLALQNKNQVDLEALQKILTQQIKTLNDNLLKNQEKLNNRIAAVEKKIGLS